MDKPKKIVAYLGAGLCQAEDGSAVPGNQQTVYSTQDQIVDAPFSLWHPQSGSGYLFSLNGVAQYNKKDDNVERDQTLSWKLSSEIISSSATYYWDNTNSDVVFFIEAPVGNHYALRVTLTVNPEFEWETSKDENPDAGLPFIHGEYTGDQSGDISCLLRVRIINPISYPELATKFPEEWTSAEQIVELETWIRHMYCARWWESDILTPIAETVVTLSEDYPIVPAEFRFETISLIPIAIIINDNTITFTLIWTPTGETITLIVKIDGIPQKSFQLDDGELDAWNIEFFTEQTWNDAGVEVAVVVVETGTLLRDFIVGSLTQYPLDGGRRWMPIGEFQDSYENYYKTSPTVGFDDLFTPGWDANIAALEALDTTFLIKGSGLLYTGESVDESVIVTATLDVNGKIIGVNLLDNPMGWCSGWDTGTNTPVPYELPEGGGWESLGTTYIMDWSYLDTSQCYEKGFVGGINQDVDGYYSYTNFLPWVVEADYRINIGVAKIQLFARRKLWLLPFDATIGKNPYFSQEDPDEQFLAVGINQHDVTTTCTFTKPPVT
jgi:hypothetical protein